MENRSSSTKGGLMEMPKSVIFVALFLLLSLHGECSSVQKKSYIVYLGSHSHGWDAAPEVYAEVENSHYEFLSTFVGSYENAKDAIFYSYTKHINGFVAILTDDEASEIRKHPDVISVFLNQMKKLQTTNSWNFMGLEHKSGAVPHNSLWRKANFGEDVIIANIDSGVWPESKSFDDDGYGPIPSRWRGGCDNNTASGVPCNRKIIGAKFFIRGYESFNDTVDPSTRSARDFEGHGTHTLSTLGGNFVPGVDLFGLARGTAKGGAPRARLAAYKICWTPWCSPDGKCSTGACNDGDMLAAFDAAIHDGVDVLSISMSEESFFYVTPYLWDTIAIGALHAVKHGITVVCAGGNSGPLPYTVANMAPWILTVAASTQDREIHSFVKVQTEEGDYKWFKGQSYSEPFPDHHSYPMITGEHARSSSSNASDENRQCLRGTLDPEKVKGKILVCQMFGGDDDGEYAAEIGAVGLVYYNAKSYGDILYPKPYLLPAITISSDYGAQLIALLNTTTKETLGSITAPTTKYNVKPAPFVAGFSARGPNYLSPEILKPDITAPGVDILAAYSEGAPVGYVPSDQRRVAYTLMSGTSMSTPHVAGVVGLLKSIHPDWSPAIIKSAIMTTASTIDNRHKNMMDDNRHDRVTATPFDYGSGHIRANQAADPGLVYDMSTKDYLNFLCASGYSQADLNLFLEKGDDFKCSDSTSRLDLNYPSIMVPNLNKTVTVTRRLKNVGPPATYKALVLPPKGVNVTVDPSILTFETVGEEKEYTVSFEEIGGADDLDLNDYPPLPSQYSFGELTWVDGKHFVRSPIGVLAI